MAITLMPASDRSQGWLAGAHLEVRGDITGTLVIPVARASGAGHYPDGCYYIAVSDGTYLRASNDPNEPDFQTIRSGPAGVSISKDCLSVTIADTVAWISLSPNQGSHLVAQEDIASMPLFA